MQREFLEMYIMNSSDFHSGFCLKEKIITFLVQFYNVYLPIEQMAGDVDFQDHSRKGGVPFVFLFDPVSQKLGELTGKLEIGMDMQLNPCIDVNIMRPVLVQLCNIQIFKLLHELFFIEPKVSDPIEQIPKER